MANDNAAKFDHTVLEIMPNESGSNEFYLMAVQRRVLHLIAKGGDGAFRRASQFVSEKDFEPLFADMFLCCYQLHEDGDKVAPFQICERLQREHKTDALRTFQNEIINPAHSIAESEDVEQLAQTLARESLRKRMIDQYHSVLTRLQDGADVYAELETMRRESEDVLKNATRSDGAIPASEWLAQAAKEIEDERAGRIIRIPTGLPALDEATGGIRQQDLWTLTGVPASGKSFLALQIAVNAATQNVPAVVISMEMGAARMGRRLARAHGIYTHSPDAELLLKAKAKELEGLPLYGYYHAMAARQLIGQCWQFVYKHGARLFVIDYLQLIPMERGARVQQWEQLDELVRALKQFAEQSGAGVLLVSSLALKSMNGRRAIQMGDMRGTGTAEYHADVCLALELPDEQDEAYRELKTTKIRDGKKPEPIALRFSDDTLTFSITERRENLSGFYEKYSYGTE